MDNFKIIPDHPLPLTFNPYKHHLGFLRTCIKIWRKKAWSDVEDELNLIGNNLIDLYYGNLTTEKIMDEVVGFAESNRIHSPEKLSHWLKPFEYRKILLSDNSVWIIRQGKDPVKFLHLHPGKYSLFTMRIRAATLKTVLACKILTNEASLPDLKAINKIRTDYLQMSPVKGIYEGKGIAFLLVSFDSI